jgi:hypothetical protein
MPHAKIRLDHVYILLVLLVHFEPAEVYILTI